MTVPGGRPVLTVVVCGAGPASHVTALTGAAIERGWDVQVVATPAALPFLDTTAIAQETGAPVRSEYSPPGSARSKVPNVIIVAPATYNTVCKWAFGTSDTYALGILAEMTGMGIPVIVLPYVNAALAARAPFRRAVESLREEGVHILIGPGLIEPHQPRSGNDPSTFPWHLALNKAEHLRREVQAQGAASAGNSDALWPSGVGVWQLAREMFVTPAASPSSARQVAPISRASEA